MTCSSGAWTKIGRVVLQQRCEHWGSRSGVANLLTLWRAHVPQEGWSERA